jgi:hypothetical protein
MGERAHHAERSTARRQCLVEALVDLSIAVVVLTVTDLIGRRAFSSLTAVFGVVVVVVPPVVTHEPTLPRSAGGICMLACWALVVAAATVGRVRIQGCVLVDLSIAVVVLTVAGLGLPGRRGDRAAVFAAILSASVQVVKSGLTGSHRALPVDAGCLCMFEDAQRASHGLDAPMVIADVLRAE